MNNFGDLIGPELIARILQEREVDEPMEERRLLSVGSVMHFAGEGDTIWGAGINGKVSTSQIPSELDVRAVRGPRTAEVLQSRGIEVPSIFGDPGLLWAHFWPREHYLRSAHVELIDVAVIPNLHDLRSTPRRSLISPVGLPSEVIPHIARSRFVCGSSLHGIVLAESFGIPARLITSQVEPSFKYDDYYEGTGRSSYRAASSVEEAIEMGGEAPPKFDSQALLGAFPWDLWQNPRR